MRLELGHGLSIEVHSPSPVRLGSRHVDLASDGQQGLADRDPSAVEIDVDPAEPGNLPTAGSSHRQHVQSSAQSVTLDQLEEVSEFGRSPVAQLLGPGLRARGLGPLRHVPGDEPGIDRIGRELSGSQHEH